MIELLTPVAWAFGLMYLLWLFYLAAMSLIRARRENRISKVALFFGYPLVIVGVILDFLTNVLVMTPMLLELPKELLVTQRLQRTLEENKSPWRVSVAKWICGHLLDTFDPTGDHCNCKHKE